MTNSEDPEEAIWICTVCKAEQIFVQQDKG